MKLKMIALIDTRGIGDPGVSLGSAWGSRVHSPDMMAAFAANDAFQMTAASDGHIRTKMVTLKDPLDAGEAVRQN